LRVRREGGSEGEKGGGEEREQEEPVGGGMVCEWMRGLKGLFHPPEATFFRRKDS